MFHLLQLKRNNLKKKRMETTYAWWKIKGYHLEQTDSAVPTDLPVTTWSNSISKDIYM